MDCYPVHATTLALGALRDATPYGSHDSDTLSGTSRRGFMVKPLRTSRKVASATVRDTVDAFLSSPRCANPNTRRAYTGVLDRVLDEIGAEVELGQVSGEQLAEVLERLWGERSPATWNRNRAAVAAWLSWCARRRPRRSGSVAEHRTATRAGRRHAGTAPHHPRAGALAPRRAATREDPVADAVRDCRPRQRGPRPQHRRPRPRRPPRRRCRGPRRRPARPGPR